MIRSQETERQLRLLDKAIADKQVEILNALHDAHVINAVLKSELASLHEVLTAMLEEYKLSRFTFSTIERAYKVLAKTSPALRSKAAKGE